VSRLQTDLKGGTMKTLKSFLILLSVVLLAAAPAPAPKKSTPGFDKLKSLVGDWEGKTDSGQAVHASYKLVSAGTALMETLHTPGEMDMVTLYHADGDQLMMTHYCAANNQPRMRAEATGDLKKLTFNYVDAANLSSPTEGHMSGLVVTLDDPDHFSQAWIWTGEGGGKPETFHFQRKK